jgi:hypothetical protein
MRVRFSHIAAIVLTGALLSACAATSQHSYLPDPARDKIGSTDVVLPIRQNEIYVFVPQAQAPNGGILGALIAAGVDSVRTSKAEDAVKPLRDATVDYAYDKTLSDDMKASLSALPWLGVDKVRVSKQITADGLESELQSSTDGALLVAVSDYRLDNDGNILTVTLNVMLLPHNDALRAIKGPIKSPLFKGDNALYRTSLAYVAKLPSGSSADRDVNIAAWSASNGAPMKAALDAATKKLASMLATDVARPSTDIDPTSGTNVDVPGLSPFGNAVPGFDIGHDADGTTVRFKDGSTAFVTHAVVP